MRRSLGGDGNSDGGDDGSLEAGAPPGPPVGKVAVGDSAVTMRSGPLETGDTALAPPTDGGVSRARLLPPTAAGGGLLALLPPTGVVTEPDGATRVVRHSLRKAESASAMLRLVDFSAGASSAAVCPKPRASMRSSGVVSSVLP